MTRSFFSCLLTVCCLLLASCASKKEYAYPQDPDDLRRERHGKILGEDGLSLFGPKEDAAAATSGITVNSFLWRATLDTLAFMPLASADPFGGVIITDWYEDPENRGERFKVNVTILDNALRADGLKASIFRQKFEDNSWRDQVVDPQAAKKLEDSILTRARELRINQTVKK